MTHIDHELFIKDTTIPQMEVLVELHDNIMFYLFIILFGLACIFFLLLVVTFLVNFLLVINNVFFFRFNNIFIYKPTKKKPLFLQYTIIILQKKSLYDIIHNFIIRSYKNILVFLFLATIFFHF